MRILVTGGLGFLGSHVAGMLADQGHQVSVLDDASRGADENLRALGQTLPIISGDVRDPKVVRDAVADSEIVVHMAAVQGTATFYREPERVLDVNVGGTIEVVRAAAASGVRRVVFASSSEIYATPPVVPTPETVAATVPDVLNARFSYSGSKIIGELMVINYARQAGMEFTVLRYHNVYGPRMGWDHVIPQFIARLERSEEFTVQGDGTQTRAFCYVSDAAEATARAATRETAANRIINVGNQDEECSIRQLIALLSEVSGKTIAPVFGPPAEGGTPRRCPSTELARELLDYAPKVALRDGLERTYRWYAGAIRAIKTGQPPAS